MNTRNIAGGIGLLFVFGALSFTSATHLAAIEKQQMLLSSQVEALQKSFVSIEKRLDQQAAVSDKNQQPRAPSDLSKSSEQRKSDKQLRAVVSALARKVLEMENEREKETIAATKFHSLTEKETLDSQDSEVREEISTEVKFGNLAERISTSATQNPDWANSMTSTLEGVLLTDAKYTELESANVACGNRLCSVDVVIPGHLDNYQQQELEWHVLFDMQKSLPEVTYTYNPTPDGGKKIVYIFAEKGEDLSGN